MLADMSPARRHPTVRGGCRGCLLTDEELAAACKVDTERHGSDGPDAAIERIPSAFAFLDAKGFHYYLPAYLWCTLRFYEQSTSTATQTILYTLALPPWDDSIQRQ